MRYCIISILLFLAFVATAQQDEINLEYLLRQAEDQAIQIKTAKSRLEIADARFQLYRADLRPTLGLDLLLPNFINTSTQVTQPDGSIAFQRVSQNNSSLSLYANQNIAATGATLFAQSDLQRFDNFSNEIKQYNGVPLRVGFIQPLFAYNEYKWQKRILPLQQIEAKYQYNIAKEDAKWQTANLYFDILSAKARKEIAETNKNVNEKLLQITKERYELGKTSENEILQLEMELQRAILSEKQSQIQEKQAVKALQAFLRDTNIENKTCLLPETILKKFIDVDVLILKAKSNRPEIIQYQREVLQREQELASTKSQYGLQSNILAVFGLAKASENLNEIYQNPFTEQQVRFNISIPIYDGGKRREAVKIAQLNKRITTESNEQNLLQIENEIRSASLGFLQAQEDVEILLEIKKLAEKRFDISTQRYTLGKISITDLTLAQREKDQIYRDYISALRNYWTSYYQLRTLTGENI